MSGVWTRVRNTNKIINMKFTNGNINDPRVEQNIKKHYPNGLDFCYTDPPWGNGNLNYWQTMNNKNNDENMNDQITQEELENIVVNLITNNVNNYAFIVYGKREASSMMSKFKAKKNVKDIQYIKKKYRSGSNWLENCIIVVTLNNAEVKDWSILNGLNGIKSLQKVCEVFKGQYKSCLELFIGIGYYLKVLHKNGFDVVGNELSKARLSKALKKIQ